MKIVLHNTIYPQKLRCIVGHGQTIICKEYIDYAEIEGYKALVIIDIHSKWIEAIPLKTTTATTTIEALRRFFASLGLPEEIISDNSPQFVATEFVTFCSRNGIKNTRTPPYHPATNGAAERAVQVVKQAIKKMEATIPLSTRLARFLLIYRTTPHSTTEMHPDELFLHWHLRTCLTLTQPNLSPTIEKHQQQQKQSHDKRTELVIFSKDETVLVRNQRGKERWLPGRIVKQKGPVTYLVRVGSQIRYCHVDHLLRTGVKPSAIRPEEHDEITDIPNSDQPSTETEILGSSNSDDTAPAENESATANATTYTTIHCSSHIRQPTRRLVEEI